MLSQGTSSCYFNFAHEHETSEITELHKLSVL